MHTFTIIATGRMRLNKMPIYTRFPFIAIASFLQVGSTRSPKRAAVVNVTFTPASFLSV